jgi:hypothetical protein
MSEQAQHNAAADEPPEPRCADLEGTLDDLVSWAMALPLDPFHEHLHRAVVQLALDALDDCHTRTGRSR